LYTDNHALQFITRQEKLNQRHAKWVEFMQNFTFVIKHISGSANKDTYALSRICLILFQVETLAFEHLKEMYRGDTDFKEDYEDCENPLMRDRSPWMEYLIQEGLLFKGSSVMYPEMFNEGQFVEGKAQWRIGWTFWP
jgi:hypothetical protein